MAFSEIRVRMKDGHELYSQTKLAASNDVAFLFGSKIDGCRGNTMAVLNVNAKGQVISMDIGSLNHFRKHIRETIKRSILSNAMVTFVITNGIDSSIKRTLSKEYQAVYETFNIQMIDFICKDKDGQYMSYRSKDIINNATGVFGTSFDAGTDGDKNDRRDISQVHMERISDIKGVATSQDAISHVQNVLCSLDREAVYVISHDEYGRPMNYYLASMGDLSSAAAHPREIFKGAILSNATSITMLHNHPSGDSTPSQEDDRIILEMQSCGAVLGINLKDSLIIGEDVYSYEERGKLLGQDDDYYEAETIQKAVAENGKTKVFVDMDGTLAEFRHVNTLETLYERGYFAELKPMENVVDAVSKLHASGRYDVYILSSVLTDSDFALEEKNEWLDRYLPQIPYYKRLFPPCGVPKNQWLADFQTEVDGSCILIDDYSKNLFEWEQQGKGIKLMNGINGTIGSWKGARIDHNDPALYSSLTEAIKAIEKEGLMPEFEQTTLAEQIAGKRDLFMGKETMKVREIDI